MGFIARYGLSDMSEIHIEEKVSSAEEIQLVIQIKEALKEDVLKNIPNFYCPLTHDLLQDPVVTEDGITYEKQAIKDWFNKCTTENKPLTSPMTNQILFFW
ncbi:unnamed protein product [Didymodactylos carnosus]|uniref:U-box domain-containing protein n=1 Tax=Didymodactylos carnosus TaxID=1234261 RepID=A0A815Y055_9BILA|nr:unnamed protein product [Didymodactylos carnosus]CAF4425531.1 unnamed protein product [Didymodactylos carnosus]